MGCFGCCIENPDFFVPGAKLLTGNRLRLHRGPKMTHLGTRCVMGNIRLSRNCGGAAPEVPDHGGRASRTGARFVTHASDSIMRVGVKVWTSCEAGAGRASRAE